MELLELVLGIVVSSGPALEQPLGAAHQPASPVLNLVRVHVVVLGPLREGLLPSHRGHGHLRLERRRVIPAFASHLLVLCAGFSDHDRRHLRNRDPCPTDGVHLSLLPLECSNQTTSCGRTPDQRESCRRCRPDRTKACWPWCHLRGDSIPSSVRSSYYQRKILTIMARSAMLTSTEAGTPASLRVGRRIHGLDQARTPAASRA